MTNLVFRPGKITNSAACIPSSHNVVTSRSAKYSPIFSNIQNMKVKYVISVVIPGYEKNEINMVIENNKLSITGSKEETNEVKFIRREFDYSKFEKAFILPEDVQIDKIEANMANGLLEVHIPKAEVKPAINIAVK